MGLTLGETDVDCYNSARLMFPSRPEPKDPPVTIRSLSCCVVLAWSNLAWSNLASAAEEPEPVVECRRASTPIEIDGAANEPAWQRATVVDGFAVSWKERPRPARTGTKARLLWDDEFLYFHAEMEDADLYADVTEHDGMIWNNDVFELFFRPDEMKRGYYEFEISAANTVLDMYLPSRGSGGYARWKKAHPFSLKTAVKLRGTLNDPRDRDGGWSVEGRIPWRDFGPTGGRPDVDAIWRFALCRYDYSVDFEDLETSSSAPLKAPSFHRYEDYQRLRFVGR